MDPQINRLLEILSKESSVIQPKFDSAKKSILLVSPSDYISMIQNMGLQTLHYVLNKNQKVNVARSFISSKKEDNCIYSLDFQKDAQDYDLIGFSITNPLQIKDFFKWMSKAKIPVERELRTERDPLIVAGGIGISNPLPFEKFIDVFFMGDAQKALMEFTDYYRNNNRKTLLNKFSNSRGIYIPEKTTKKYNPLIESDSLIKGSLNFKNQEASLSLDRGCKFGCDFCQYFYNTGRKYLAFDLGELKEEVDKLQKLGANKLNIYSASSGNHPYFKEIMKYIQEKDIKIGLLDTRLEQLDDETLKIFSSQGSLPLNLDAPSDRIRRIIKRSPIKDEAFLNKIKIANSEYSIDKFSLYYIINYPGENVEDRSNIASFINKTLEENILVDLVIFPLFPSPNTPLQRAQMQLPHITKSRIEKIAEQIKIKGEERNKIDYDIAGEHELFINKGRLNIRSIPLIHQLIEGLTLRGDRQSGQIVYDLWRENLLERDSLYPKAIRYLDENHPKWKKYFDKIEEGSIPWAMVAPSNVQDYCEKRYLKLKRQLKA